MKSLSLCTKKGQDVVYNYLFEDNQFSLDTVFLNVPIFSISISTKSPGDKNLGFGFMKTPTPAGVPVAIMSPGSKVIT